jgi:uncharacterized protein (DUF169 family)
LTTGHRATGIEEVNMLLTKKDFAVLDRFKFKIKPVGMKLLANPPEGIGRLDGRFALCEMIKKAQEGEVFYADVENHTCEAGPYVLGQKEIEKQFVNGEFGAGMGVFRDARAAARLYHYIPKIARDVVDYIVFCPADRLPFDPDVMLFLADIDQTHTLLRASSYETGSMWSSRYSAAVGCSWLVVYPYLSGEINFIGTGLGFGMKRRRLFPEGFQFVSVPFDRLSSLLQTLNEMPWVPKPFEPEGPEYVRLLRLKLGLD